ncbi:FAD-dependent oxidoreductase [Lachnospiraceae bacterium OttesenSCG-928-D06]|nr:FAD-dependent oxidoreductase [Lachnospiraceae bacterium OttesenSCG-928-D06]
MIRINQLKMRPGHSREALLKKAASLLGIKESEVLSFSIVRRSIDARKKPEIFYSYVIDIECEDNKKLRRKMANNSNIIQVQPIIYKARNERFQKEITREERPIVVGSGPAGLFCAYILAVNGLRPFLLERGECVEKRILRVEKFWQDGILNKNSNVQFGEGGAGTFSDGKLNTLVKDKGGRNRFVLETFVKFGAEEKILYDAKPHVGTDILSNVVKNMREEISSLGGEVFFSSEVTDLLIESGKIKGVVINGEQELYSNHVVMAIGHSARDTFEMLYEKNIKMEAKAFAVGFRVMHSQKMINESQYGITEPTELGAAPYKVTAKTRNGRGVYSFCMCPGGYVVNASSEENGLAVNGMSYSKRAGSNANSAIIVSVKPDDFESNHPLSGVAFQRELEKKAFQAGGGKIPIQNFYEFKQSVLNNNTESSIEPILKTTIEPGIKGAFVHSDLSGILPMPLNEAFIEGMEQFEKQIPGYSRCNPILAGVESRTSSPLRILRDNTFQGNVEGLYPCGEGAGYAGGITSAAMDGILTAEAIMCCIAP